MNAVYVYLYDLMSAATLFKLQVVVIRWVKHVLYVQCLGK